MFLRNPLGFTNNKIANVFQHPVCISILNDAAGKIPTMIVSWFTVISAMKLQNSLKSVVFLFNMYIEGPYNVIKKNNAFSFAHNNKCYSPGKHWSSYEKTCFYIYVNIHGTCQPAQLNSGNFYIHSTFNFYIFVFKVLQLIVCRQFSVIQPLS